VGVTVLTWWDLEQEGMHSRYCWRRVGGAEGDRTPDLRAARADYYILSRSIVSGNMAKISRKPTITSSLFPATYYPILTRLQYGCSTLVPSPRAYKYGFAYSDSQNDTPMCVHEL
jgi:hypothetical protein